MNLLTFPGDTNLEPWQSLTVASQNTHHTTAEVARMFNHEVGQNHNEFEVQCGFLYIYITKWREVRCDESSLCTNESMSLMYIQAMVKETYSY